MGTVYRSQLKAMRTPVIRPLQGYGNTASLGYPDTWVRKPGCLHLPYSGKDGQMYTRVHVPCFPGVHNSGIFQDNFAIGLGQWQSFNQWKVHSCAPNMCHFKALTFIYLYPTFSFQLTEAVTTNRTCLLYTSDAADETSTV